MTSDQFTTNESGAAVYLAVQAVLAASVYAGAGDIQAATIAVLRAALNLAGGDASADRLAVLESENIEFYSELVKLRGELV